MIGEKTKRCNTHELGVEGRDKPSHKNLGRRKHFVSILNVCSYCIRECGSILYVELARAVSPTNTNFRSFLLTRLQEALYEDLAV